jgi:hypothetical protein
MAKITVGAGLGANLTTNKKTSQGHKNVKMASMNKGKKRGYKKYRGQGK